MFLERPPPPEDRGLRERGSTRGGLLIRLHEPGPPRRMVSRVRRAISRARPPSAFPARLEETAPSASAGAPRRAARAPTCPDSSAIATAEFVVPKSIPTYCHGPYRRRVGAVALLASGRIAILGEGDRDGRENRPRCSSSSPAAAGIGLRPRRPTGPVDAIGRCGPRRRVPRPRRVGARRKALSTLKHHRPPSSARGDLERRPAHLLRLRPARHRRPRSTSTPPFRISTSDNLSAGAQEARRHRHETRPTRTRR